MGNEENLKKLLIRATKDVEFRGEFLKNPVEVGKKHGVSFTPEQIAKIKGTYTFIESLQDIIVYPPPWPGYPLYEILVRWKIDEVYKALPKYVAYYIEPPVYVGPIIPPRPQPGYPMPWMRYRLRRRYRY